MFKLIFLISFTHQNFCTKIYESLSQYSYSQDSFLNALRQGDKKQYLNLASGQKLNRVSVANLLAKTIPNLSSEPLLTFSVDELKYLPFMQSASNVILVTNTAQPLNMERVQVLIQNAKTSQIKLHIFWTGSLENSLDREILSNLALQTGGIFTDISSLQCEPQI